MRSESQETQENFEGSDTYDEFSWAKFVSRGTGLLVAVWTAEQLIRKEVEKL